MKYGTVTGRFAAAIADTTDDQDLNPDVVPLAGKVTFTPSAAALKVIGEGLTILPAPIECTLDAQGYLTLNGVRSVNLIATDTDDTNPRDFTYRVTFAGLAYGATQVTYAPFSIEVPAGETIDLATVAPAGASNGVAILRGPTGLQGDPGEPGPQGPPGPADAERQKRRTALTPWWFALANRENKPAVARFGPGDSITEGQGATTRDRRWVARAQTALRQRFQNAKTGTGGGVGWIDPYQAANSFGQPAATSAGLGKDTGFGLSRRSLILKSSADTWTITVKGTSVDLHGVQVNSAKATVTVDGGAAQSISFGGAGVADGKIVRVALGASGAHTIVLAGDTGSTYFTGMYVYDGDESAGIQTFGNGTFGQSTGYFAAFDAPKPIQAIQPSLFVIALSINDYSANGSAETARQNLLQIIANCKANVNTPPSFVLMPYYLRTGAFTGDAWSKFVAAHYAIAEADPSVCVLDLSTRMPAASTDTKNVYYVDGVHPSDMSHSFIADQLVEFISPI